ncbi:MAG: hypothetical protein WCU80_09415 [Paludibacteraceae bacterium]
MSVSAPNEEFLTKRFIIPKMYEIMNPLLAWTDVFPQVRATAPVVGYKQELTSDAKDTKKQKPKLKTTSGQWTYVEISQFTMKAATLNKKGFAIKIDQDALDYVEGVDEIQRAFRKTAYWIAEDYNDRISSEIAANGTALAGDWTPAAVWSDPNAAPIADLEELEDAFIREGYAYRLTDVFIHKDNFKELKKYLTSLDINQYKQENLYGTPNNGKRDSIEIPVVGTTVHRLLSGVDEGSIIAIDKDNPGITIFYNQSPRYSAMNGAYDTVVNGQKVSKSLSYGFNFNKYFDNETHETVIQLWYDNAPVTIEPYAVATDTGI